MRVSWSSPLLLSLALCFGSSAEAADRFRDVLDTPAQASALAAQAPLAALARAGGMLVVAGSRGHVLWSGDEGVHWMQAQVPVSSDLVALSFPESENGQLGWAVGHDGVILHTEDGGRTWRRQLDGRWTGKLMHEQSGQPAEQGAETPLLDVCFVDALRGWAVGAFGLILGTEDGGKHWQLESKQADNPKGLHLYAVRAIAGQIYIVGEQGLLLRRAADGRFEALPQPYAGTLFGIVGDDKVLLIHGLRGHALRSTDGGRNWQPVETGLQVGLTANARAADGSWLLASQAGHVLVSHDGALSFQPLKLARSQPASALLSGSAGLVIAGPRGVLSTTPQP